MVSLDYIYYRHGTISRVYIKIRRCGHRCIVCQHVNELCTSGLVASGHCNVQKLIPFLHLRTVAISSQTGFRSTSENGIVKTTFLNDA